MMWVLQFPVRTMNQAHGNIEIFLIFLDNYTNVKLYLHCIDKSILSLLKLTTKHL